MFDGALNLCYNYEYTWLVNLHQNFECGYITVWMWLVRLNCNFEFECDWLIWLSYHKLSNNKLPDNKLSDMNLASELVEKGFFKNQSQSRK